MSTPVKSAVLPNRLDHRPAGPGVDILRKVRVGMSSRDMVSAVARDQGLWARMTDMVRRSYTAGHETCAVRQIVDQGEQGVIVILRCEKCGAGVKFHIDANNHLWTDGRAVETVCPGTQGKVYAHLIPEQTSIGADVHHTKVKSAGAA